MSPYMMLANSCGYDVVIVEIETFGIASLQRLAERNIHGVSRETIEAMMLAMTLETIPEFWKATVTKVKYQF
jgi:hypothetical protein